MSPRVAVFLIQLPFSESHFLSLSISAQGSSLRLNLRGLPWWKWTNPGGTCFWKVRPLLLGSYCRANSLGHTGPCPLECRIAGDWPSPCVTLGSQLWLELQVPAVGVGTQSDAALLGRGVGKGGRTNLLFELTQGL